MPRSAHALHGEGMSLMRAIEAQAEFFPKAKPNRHFGFRIGKADNREIIQPNDRQSSSLGSLGAKLIPRAWRDIIQRCDAISEQRSFLRMMDR